MSKHLKNKKKKGEASQLKGVGRRKQKRSKKLYLLVGLLGLAMLAYVLTPLLNSPKVNKSNGSNPSSSSDINININDRPDDGINVNNKSSGVNAKHNINFEKEGVLSFKKADGKIIKTVDIEVSDTESERDQGLMYRQNFSDGQAMLFIFQREKLQAFWMKNTYVPLDIIYVGANKKIVSIAKNAQPRNTASLPSSGPAQYVVEVPGGFSDGYGLQTGDEIYFELNGEAK